MTVYAVQMQMKFDQEKGELVPRFESIEKAEKWGDIVYLLSSGQHPFKADLALGDLHEKLKYYSDGDYLLLIGNPVLIGMATGVAAHYNGGKVSFLQWSGKFKEYSEITAKIF